MREKKFITSGSVFINRFIQVCNPILGGLTALWKNGTKKCEKYLRLGSLFFENFV